MIVTALKLPGLNGLDVLRILRAERIDSKVVLITVVNDGEVASEALREGASALLLMTISARTWHNSTATSPNVRPVQRRSR